MDSLSDHNLMLKVKGGDLEKASLLYARYSRRLFGFFYRMTNNGSASEDLVQNVFVRLIKYRQSYHGNGNFQTWVFQLARNVHHDQYKKEKRYNWQEDMSTWEGELRDNETAETKKLKSDEMDLLSQAIGQLSAEKRELLELTKFQKMKYEEVARLFDTSEGAIKVRLHRILKELREIYEKLEAI